MKIKSGWRYRAVVHGEGEFEGVLVGKSGEDVWPEGGGEVRMPRWEMRLDDSTVIEVQEASLKPLEPTTLGDSGGPIVCPVCGGRGSRPKPQGLSSQLCPRCGGDGFAYPTNA